MKNLQIAKMGGGKNFILKRNAFTLIELLAVIIILSVIALIATPIVLNVVDSAKLKAFEESSYGIIETVKLKNYEYMFEGTNTNKTYTFPTDELVFQGEKPEGGTVVLQNGNTALAIHNGKWCATKKLGDEKITITEDIENCDLKLVSLSGNITGVDTFRGNETYDQIIPIEGKVQLINNNKIIYETNSDSEGNYSFEDIVNDEYILLVSQPYKTKYGIEIFLADDTTKDMEATLQYGDFNNDNIINEIDMAMMRGCLYSDDETKPKCQLYDLNGDGYINAKDTAVIKVVAYTVTQIAIDKGTYNVSGKISSDIDELKFASKAVVKLSDGTNNYTSSISQDGTFSFENIPGGYYGLIIPKATNITHYGKYNKFIVVDNDLNIDVKLYYGDLDSNEVLDNFDLTYIEEVIEMMNNGEEGYEYEDILECDMNKDGVIDDEDIRLLKINIEKYKASLDSGLYF